MMIGLILIFGVISHVQSNGPIIADCPVDWQDLDNITDNLNLQVICGDTYIDVMINNTCILEEEGFNITTDITINGLSGVTDDCDDLIELPDMMGHCWGKRLPQPFDNCGTAFRTEGDEIIYRNSVAIYKFANLMGHVIWRNKLIYLNFECRYPAAYHNLSLEDFGGSGIEVIQNPHNATAVIEDGEYNFTVRGCFDEPRCTDVILPYTPIKICQPIYIIITTTRDVTIYIYRVTAYDLADHSGEHHTIVNGDGCIVDDEEPFPATIDYSGTGITILRVYAFQWADNLDRELYFDVSFGFCDSDAGQTCTPPCGGDGGRRRRAIPSGSSQGITTTTLGPWKVV